VFAASTAAVVMGAAVAAAEWPLWDGKESVADYAKRAGIKDVQMELDLGSGVSMKLTLIPAGKYMRGLREEQTTIIEGVRVLVREADKGWNPHSGPQSEVTLTKPFYMGIHEVTQEQFEQVMGENPSFFKGKTNPMDFVAWSSVANFCKKVSALTGRDVMLPTEAQWEYAYRAGTKTWFYWGDDAADMYKFENYGDKSLSLNGLDEGERLPNISYGTALHLRRHFPRRDMDHSDGFDKTAPVGSFKPNPWGLYDMHANVMEFVQDYHRPSHFGAPTVDPAGPGYACQYGGIAAVPHSFTHWYKGSSWLHSDKGWFRPFFEGGGYPDNRLTANLGFRIVVALKSTGTPAQEAKAKNPPKVAPASPAPATAGPGDPKVRVPPGCRAAPGTQAEPYTKSGWAQAIVHEATGMEMLYIPAGSFLMGILPYEESDGIEETTPYVLFCMKQHLVTLTKGFYMGKTEVTQAQWEKLMGKNPSHFKDAGPEAPVEMVSWDDCQSFCEKAGNGLRLPTEAEWEYACRAGTTSLYAGDPEAMGWYFSNSDGATHPVGAKKPNAWGLHDMHGNVWEWCQDYWYQDASRDAVTDPTGPAREPGYHSGRVMRGGGWGDYGTYCISAVRFEFPVFGKPAPTSVALGCRFVITAAGAP
jgi:formylglycine-generating enzyme required for sulfatase activity